MGERRFKIQEVIDKQTSKFSNTSSIIDHFNDSLVDYDMFWVNRNADIRYQNTRSEMLLAIDEICDLWAAQKRDRDKWIEENKEDYIHKYVRELQIQWADDNKSCQTVSLPESLETRIANFVQKLKGQIILRETLQGSTELSLLESAVKYGIVPGTGLIFDFNDEFFRSHGTNLVKKYY